MTILDYFILSQLERGLETPYDLMRRAGVSLGASVPALRRLSAAGFIKKGRETSVSNRPRHVYKLTADGMKQARTGWKQYLQGKSNLVDLDEILRVCDMASHNNHDQAGLAAFLDRAARDRSVLASQAQIGIDLQSAVSLDYMSIRAKCEIGRLTSDEAVLSQLASAVKKNSVRRQRAMETKRKPDR
jgi:DNA-binding PadR family transcriptional regulator